MDPGVNLADLVKIDQNAYNNRADSDDELVTRAPEKQSAIESTHDNIAKEDMAHDNLAKDDMAYDNLAKEDMAHDNLAKKDMAHDNLAKKDMPSDGPAAHDTTGGDSDDVTYDIQQVSLARCRICKLVMVRSFMDTHIKTNHREISGRYGSYGFVRKTFTR